MMKKLISLLMVCAIVLSMSVMTVSATEAGGNWGDGTFVSYNAEDPDGDGVADNFEAYTVTVPAMMAPGDTSEVVVAGTWNSARKVIVTADEEVVLENSINPSNTKTLAVTFGTLEKEGDNTAAIEVKKDIEVADIEDALFGVWSGTITYTAEIVDVQ